MKKNSVILMIALLGLIGCQEKSSKKKSAPAPAPAPTPVVQPTPTTGGYTTGGYSTTGGSIGGTTTGTTAGGGYYGSGIYKDQPPSDNDWESYYPNGVPAENCSAPTGEGDGLRIGTITASGGTMYYPGPHWKQDGTEFASYGYSHNISNYLTDTSKAKSFFENDARLRVRFKVLPQPKVPVANSKTWCFGRLPNQPDEPSSMGGYDELRFNVALRGVNADGSLSDFASVKSLSAKVNACTQTVDFSGLNQQFPHGVVLSVYEVQRRDCWYSKDCTSFGAVRQASCWQMQIQVSVDNTKEI